MKKSITIILTLVSILISTSLHAQFIVNDTYPSWMNSPAAYDSDAPIIVATTGTTAIAAGIISMFILGSNDKTATPLYTASQILTACGLAASVAGFSTLLFRTIPSKNIHNFGPYVEMNDTKNYLGWNTAGSIVLSTGMTLITGGLATYLIQYNNRTAFSDTEMNVYEILAYSGLALTLTGTIMTVWTNHSYKQKANKNTAAKLTLGGTPHGLGLGLNS